MSTNRDKADGRREDILLKQRNQMREEYERQKQSLINETEKARPSTNRFVGQNDSMEESLKNNTIGLVRLEDFQKRKKELEEAKAREAARSNDLKCVSFLIFLPIFLWALDSWKTRWLIGCGESV
jgi:protein FAM50